MKKLSLLVVAVLMLAALGGVQAQEGITLTYMASQGWIKDTELELAQQFEEETGIHIDYQIIPADQYFSVLQTKLNTGEGPDIFGGQSGASNLRILYDIEQNGVDLSDEEWATRIDPLSAAQTTLDGKLYGLTIWDTLGGVFAVVYNKAIFEQYGLEIPTTYEELKTISQTLLDNGITPIYEPIADGWHHVLWFPELGERYEEVTPGLTDALNANETTFVENETMLTAITQLNELYQMGAFGEFAMSDSGSETAARMAAGEYAMTVATLSLPFTIEEDFGVSADQFGYFVMPLADNQNINFHPGGPSKFIYSGSPNIEAAKEYFRFLTRPEILQWWVENEPDFNYLNFEGIENEFTEEQQAFFDRYPGRGPGMQVRVTYVDPQWMEMGQDLSAMFLGEAQPIDVLANVDTRRAEMAAAANDPAWNQ
jgi:raffinose/stachyose/melibiose transport system substrate-binding protein